MRIVAAASPVCSATSLIASWFTVDRPYGPARRSYHPARLDEAAQPRPGAPDRPRGDRGPRAPHGHGPRRRRALDPGGGRGHAARRAAAAVDADAPRAPRAHVLDVPLTGHARADPGDLHRVVALLGAHRPADRLAALPRTGVHVLRRPRDRALAHPGRAARRPP